MTYIHAPVNVILPRSNGITVELGNPERVVPIPSGAQGLPGEPGFSPVVSVEPITDGNRVTITDADGDTSFDVMNGAQGEQGEPGEGVPAGGAQGQVLKKASNADYDTVWSNESGTVLSVNGQTGVVVLDASDVGALPDDTDFVSSFNGSSGAVIYTAPVSSVNGQTGAVNTKPKTGSVTLTTANWTGNGPFTQTVTVTGATVTANSKVDIQPNASVIQQMMDDGVSVLFIENNAGILTAYAVGAALTVDVTVQATVTEVSV